MRTALVSMRTALVALLTVVVCAGCGGTEGRYATFTSWGDARDWEVWQQPDGAYYFRSTDFGRYHFGSCVDGGRVIELDGRVVRDSYEGDYLPPGFARYRTPDAAWTELASDFFAKRQVEQALRRGSDRDRPEWLRGFEDCKFRRRELVRN